MRMSISALRLGRGRERSVMKVGGGLRRVWIGCGVVLLLCTAAPGAVLPGKTLGGHPKPAIDGRLKTGHRGARPGR